MGVTGLLPLLKDATRACNMIEFRGATVVIDANCWLRKGANSCALQLARGIDTKRYVDYSLLHLAMLQSHNIKPILVFNGDNLPVKAGKEARQEEARNNAKSSATILLRLGNIESANRYFKQSINITAEMALAVIQECHKLKIDCIVAPYECGAQLAYFNLRGIAELVITEDSDLVLFGCSKVMFNLDLFGNGYLVEADKIPQAIKLSPEKYTFNRFRYMCILAGCDYIPSFRGIGLKKARKCIEMTEETNPEVFLDKVFQYLNMHHPEITDQYKKDFMIADATFLHQTVFDPFNRKLVPLIDPVVSGTNPEYCKNTGEIFDYELAYEVALGNLDPSTLKQLDFWDPSDTYCPSSIWSDVNLVDNRQTKIDAEGKVDKELNFSQKCSDTQKPSTSKTVELWEETNSLNYIEESDDESGSDEFIDKGVEIEADGSFTELTQNETNIEKSKDKEHVVIEVIEVSDSSDEETEVITEKLKLNSSQKDTIESSSSKRKNMGICSSVGLKRSKQEGTIQEFHRKDSFTNVGSSNKKSVSRKMQKVHREFFKSNMQADVNLVDREPTKVDKVRKLAKGLKFYSQKCLDMQKPSTSNTVDIPISPKTRTSTQIIDKRYPTSNTEKVEEESEVKKESVNLFVQLVESETETEAEDSSTELN